MTVSVKRGNNITNISSVKAKDTDTLVLTTTARIQDAEYTVTIGEKVATLTGEAEKLTTLKITGENAVVDKEIISQATKATVPYEAKNQFGEDMNSLNLAASSSLGNATPSNGIITIDIVNGSNLLEGQIVSVVIMCSEVGMSDSATVTISASSKIKTVVVDRIYNEAGLAFNEDNKGKDFYLLLNVEDQYGRKITDSSKFEDNLLMVSSNPLVVAIGVANTDGGYDTPEITDITVDGVKRVAVPIHPLSAGTANIIITPKYFGGSVTHSVTVENGAKVDTITFSQPEGAYRGEELLIPVEAYDVNGNAVTDLSRLNGDEKVTATVSGTDTTTGRFEKNYKTGEIFLNAGTVAPNAAAVSVVATTPTYKSSNIMITAREAAKPSVIAGIKDTVALAVLTGEAITLKGEDFIVYDQYDRPMDNPFANGYKIVAISNAAINGILDASGFVGTFTAKNITQTYTATSGAINSTKTETAQFVLQDSNGKTIVGSEYPVKISVVRYADLRSYEIDTADKVYAPTSAAVAHEKTFKVFGKTSNGIKVQMPVAAYDIANYLTGTTVDPVTNASVLKVNTGAGVAATVAAVSNHKAWVDATNAAETKTVTIYVSIKHDGAAITKTVTACEEAPKLTTIMANPYHPRKNAISTTGENSFMIYDTASQVSNGTNVKGYLLMLDQYSVPYTAGSAIIVINDMVSKTAKITNNGSSNPIITGLVSGDSYTAAITYAGKTINVQVIAK